MSDPQKHRGLSPILKWVGGKRQLLDSITPLLPKRISSYCEPFLGGGALLFHLQPPKAYVNDINAELMGVYQAVKDDVEALITTLEGFKNSADFFYAVRDWDRYRESYAAIPPIKRAARIIYLNKTCYNGLFRVNSAGEFNSPFGHYSNPNIVNAPLLRSVSAYLNSADVTLTSLDYAEALSGLPKDSFVYMDPPYDPLSETSFIGYSKGGFTKEEQIRLRKCCDTLNAKGIKFMLSNSATDFIKEQYAAYNITILRAKRVINSDSTKRGAVEEVVVRNYT
jgi:DNA adenine methylase